MSVFEANGVRIEAPDVGAVIEYGLDGFGKAPATYRVTAWLRERPWRASAYDMALSGALPAEAGGRKAVFAAEIVHEILEDAAKKGSPRKRRRLEFCLREVATHVCGAGVCGCVAPLEKIKVVGKVSWSEEMLADERAQAIHLGRTGELAD